LFVFWIYAVVVAHVLSFRHVVGSLRAAEAAALVPNSRQPNQQNHIQKPIQPNHKQRAIENTPGYKLAALADDAND
jgi:hypothetical protein